MKKIASLILTFILLISFAVPSFAESTSFGQSTVIFDRIDTDNFIIEGSTIVVVLDSKGIVNIKNSLLLNSDCIFVVNSSVSLFKGSSFENMGNGQIVVGPLAWITASFENKEDADTFKKSLVGKYTITQESDDGKEFVVLGSKYAQFYTGSSLSTGNFTIIYCIGSLAVGFFFALIIGKRKKDIIKE